MHKREMHARGECIRREKCVHEGEARRGKALQGAKRQNEIGKWGNRGKKHIRQVKYRRGRICRRKQA